MTTTNLIDKNSGRLYSLDALRGFDMFWIMGAEEIVHSLFKATNNSFFEAFSIQLSHPDWNGSRCSWPEIRVAPRWRWRNRDQGVGTPPCCHAAPRLAQVATLAGAPGGPAYA